MTPADGCIRPDRRQLGVRVEVDGAGDVPGVVGVARPHVDEHGAHIAPRGATSSGSTRWSGNRCSSASAQASRSVAHAMTVGPDPENVAPAQPADDPARIAVEHRRGPIRLVQPVSERRGEKRRRRRSPRRRRAEPPDRRSPRPRVRHRSPAASPREAAVDVRSVGMIAMGVERKRLGDPRDLPVPGEREPAEQCRREIVGVRLELRARRRAAPRPSHPGRPRRARGRSPRPTSRAHARAGSG